jgi:two-component system, chemotaxis family, sensor kinase CheA
MNRENYEILIQTFRQEAAELLSELETSLLDLERAPGDIEVISCIFRTFHTLKGSSAICGLDEVSRFTHHIETVYDLVRSGETIADKKLIDLTLAAIDFIKEMIESPRSVSHAEIDGRERILDSFRKLLPEPFVEVQPGGQSGVNVRIPQPVKENQITCRIHFKPSPNIFLNGTNPVLLLNELRDLGQSTVVAQTEGIPDLYALNQDLCYTSWDVILTTDRGINAVKDVFVFVEDESELQFNIIDDGTNSIEEKECRKLGEILLERRDLSNEDLERVLKDRKPIGTILVEEGLVEPGKVQSALAEQEHFHKVHERRLKEDAIWNMRVSSEKLDKLVNLVGELVTVQARLSQAVLCWNDPKLISIAEEVERLTGDLRDNTMNIRLVPIGTLFNRFNRLVRDLSKELGKEVELVTEGAETELDKTIIEKLHDPLVHLIRNSIDHGIEDPETRLTEGKPKIGTIVLSAVHSGSHVLVRIRDDGRGLDPESIYEKALEKGIISIDTKITEKEIFSLILTPGFSTARQVTYVSGRGVGLDVVQRGIETLKGSIDIASKKGSGTAITLTLPLTLAIIEGLLVKVSGENFVIPLSAVEGCVELSRRDIDHSHSWHMAHIWGQLVPYIRLRERFAINGTPPPIEYIVITVNDGVKVGLVVDHIIGEHQTVLKSLNKFCKNILELLGATILGDGSVALVLDVQKLISEFEKDAVRSSNA